MKYTIQIGGRLKGTLGKTGNVLGIVGLFIDIFSNDPHALGMQFSSGEKLNTLYYDSDTKKYFEVTSRKFMKGANRNNGVKITYTTYADYDYNKSTGKYEGVNELETYEAVQYEGEAAKHYLQQLL